MPPSEGTPSEGAAEVMGFGKKLAHTDKKIRDKGLKILTTFLVKNKNIDRLAYKKVWKGLIYSFWMSDKRPIQQELAVNLASLGRQIPPERYMSWVGAFWDVLGLDWQNFDTYRMNKFLLLVRIQTAEILHQLAAEGWSSPRVRSLAAELTGNDGPLSPQRTAGLGMAVASIWWDELSHEIEGAPVAPVLQLLEPFAQVLASARQSHVQARMSEMLQRTPAPYAQPLAGRLTEIGADEAVRQANRVLLYAAAEALGGSDRPRGKKRKGQDGEPAPKKAKGAEVKPADSPKKKAADSPKKTAAESPKKTAAESPKKTAALSPKKTAAESPKKKAAESPLKAAAGSPKQTAAESPKQKAAEVPKKNGLKRAAEGQAAPKGAKGKAAADALEAALAAQQAAEEAEAKKPKSPKKKAKLARDASPRPATPAKGPTAGEKRRVSFSPTASEKEFDKRKAVASAPRKPSPTPGKGILKKPPPKK